MAEQHEVIVRRGGGPGCIGIFLIIGFIALGAEQIGKHPVIAAGIGLALLAAAGLVLWYREQNASRAIAAAPPPPPPGAGADAKAGAMQISAALPPPSPETAAPKAPQLAEGWYADPLGEAAWRWWNGSAWTDRVSGARS